MGNAVVRHDDGRVLMGGSTTSYSFPITDGGLRDYFPVSPGGFVVEFKPSPFHIATTSLLPALDYFGASYTAQLDATGGTPPYSWGVVGFRLPEELSMSPSGTITGSWQTVMDSTGALINEHGGYQFTVKATDAIGLVAYKSFFIPMETASRLTCSNGLCTEHAELHQDVGFPVPIPVRSVPPYTVDVTGSLPPDVTLQQNGYFMGHARPEGQYQFQITATDARGKSATMAWELVVTDPTAAPAPTPTPTPLPTPGPSSGGSSGGGSIGLLVLAGIATFLCARVRQWRRYPAPPRLVSPAGKLQRPRQLSAGAYRHSDRRSAAGPTRNRPVPAPDCRHGSGRCQGDLTAPAPASSAPRSSSARR